MPVGQGGAVERFTRGAALSLSPQSEERVASADRREPGEGHPQNCNCDKCEKGSDRNSRPGSPSPDTMCCESLNALSPKGEGGRSAAMRKNG